MQGTITVQVLPLTGERGTIQAVGPPSERDILERTGQENQTSDLKGQASGKLKLS